MSEKAIMRTLLLPEESYRYLKFVFASHTKAGFAPEEVLAAADLFARIEKAPAVDFSKAQAIGLDKVKVDGPVAVALTEPALDPPGDHNGAVAND